MDKKCSALIEYLRNLRYKPLCIIITVFTYYLLKQDFIVHSIEPADMFFVLEEAVLAKKLRFVVGDAVLDTQGRICWRMFILGCTASEGVYVAAIILL